MQGKGRLAREAADQDLGQAEDEDPNERAEMDALLAEQGMPASKDKAKKGKKGWRTCLAGSASRGAA